MIEKIKSITRGQVILGALVLIIVVSIIISIKAIGANNEKKFKSYEKILVNDAKNYYKIKKPKIKRGGELKITINELNKENLLSTEEILENKCKGYVMIYSMIDNEDEESTILEYESSIKCGHKYMTPGYQE